ncbi:MAG: hypothetical protein A4E53_00361 [Pelotomaculum sp. PtaB.Bin104]|nr:MAG: hypothetical protein A4E53_00361 [Pelotomaculum sp. PtaB.Bin104]
MQETVLSTINQLIPDLFAILACLLVFYVRKLLKTWLPKIEAWIEAHTTATQRETIRKLGLEAFAYAETVYREKKGSDKLQEALAYFNQHMSKYGLSNLNADVIRAAVEAAWLEDKRKEFAPVELAEVKVFEGTK